MIDKVGKILAFIEERIKWNEDMMKRDPKPSDIGRIEEAKCIRRFIDSIQEEPKMCMYTKDDFTDEDRKTLCEGCEEDCEYNKIEEPVSKVWHDSNKEQPEYGSDVIVLRI